jgi:hypothetical protein
MPETPCGASHIFWLRRFLRLGVWVKKLKRKDIEKNEELKKNFG